MAASQYCTLLFIEANGAAELMGMRGVLFVFVSEFKIVPYDSEGRRQV